MCTPGGSSQHLSVFTASNVIQGSWILKTLVIALQIIKPCFQFDSKLNTEKKGFIMCVLKL